MGIKTAKGDHYSFTCKRCGHSQSYKTKKGADQAKRTHMRVVRRRVYAGTFEGRIMYKTQIIKLCPLFRTETGTLARPWLVSLQNEEHANGR